MIKKFKNILKKVKRTIGLLNKNIYISFGENCLSDNILERYGLKSFSSPFSSGRLNIEYILKFENEKFKDFLNLKYLAYEYLDNNTKQVVRNTKYIDTQNNYDTSCIHGFEFTHHDVRQKKLQKIMIRRCKRMMNLKHKNINILYHHRYCTSTNIDILINHLNEIRKIYEDRDNKVNIFCFTQVLVSNENERKIEHFKINNVNMYYLYTLNLWNGKNDEIFWARCDDDLIKEMINDIKNVKHR